LPYMPMSRIPADEEREADHEPLREAFAEDF
jgi:hypothetical protein